MQDNLAGAECEMPRIEISAVQMERSIYDDDDVKSINYPSFNIIYHCSGSLYVLGKL